MADHVGHDHRDALEFEDFKLKYGKTYDSQVEEAKRFQIFVANLRRIEKHNRSNLSWKEKVTKFADLTSNNIKILMIIIWIEIISYIYQY